MKIRLGRTVITPGALALAESGAFAHAALLARHERGDWGEVPPEDVEANEDALVNGDRLMSVYPVKLDDSWQWVKIWVITEADRSVTTILLPDEY